MSHIEVEDEKPTRLSAINALHNGYNAHTHPHIEAMPSHLYTLTIFSCENTNNMTTPRPTSLQITLRIFRNTHPTNPLLTFSETKSYYILLKQRSGTHSSHSPQPFQSSDHQLLPEMYHDLHHFIFQGGRLGERPTYLPTFANEGMHIYTLCSPHIHSALDPNKPLSENLHTESETVARLLTLYVCGRFFQRISF